MLSILDRNAPAPKTAFPLRGGTTDRHARPRQARHTSLLRPRKGATSGGDLGWGEVMAFQLTPP